MQRSEDSPAADRSSRRSYGTGSLYVRTDRNGRESWYAYWRTNGRAAKRRIGLRRTAGSREGLTRAQAEAELRRLMSEVKLNPRLGELLTVAQVGERYLHYLQSKGRKPSTIAAVRGHLTHWHGPFFGERSLQTIRSEDVADLIALMHAGQRPSGIRRSKRLSPASIRKVVSTLHALFGFAVKRGWASSNPVDSIELPEVTRSEDTRFLTPTEVRAVAASAIPGDHEAIDRALYVTAAMTGLREGELIALRWRDVDWTAARVRVRQNYVLGEFGTPKSKRSTRSVPMADDVAAELERLYQATEARIARQPRDDELVFVDPLTGEPLNKKDGAAALPTSAPCGAARPDPSLPRPPTHLRNPDGRGRGRDPHAAGVDGSPGYPDDDALRRLRAQHARGRAHRRRVRSDRCWPAWWRDAGHRRSANVKPYLSYA